MIGKTEYQLLEGVSRSFYLSLRLLPQAMRHAASVGYLLARTSDTLADSASIAVPMRLKYLNDFGRAVASLGDPSRWPVSLLNTVSDPKERLLLESSSSVFQWFQQLPPGEIELVQEVVAIIISGQTLDLQRFAAAQPTRVIALPDDDSLEDYCWRVAGCVGAFWTKLGFLTLGEKFSQAPVDDLLVRGTKYGKGLQLVNILRDTAADAKLGRCYLPVSDPHESMELLACHQKWRAIAEQWSSEGERYASVLCSRRLRVATVLPARIALETLKPMRTASWLDLQHRIKVPRRVIYQLLAGAFFMRRNPC